MEHGGLIKSDFISGINMEKLEQETIKNKKDKIEVIKEVREKLTSLTENIIVRPEQLEYQQYMGVARNLPQSVYHQAKGFFIPDFNYNHEIFGPYLDEKSLGLKGDSGYPVFAGRFVYPILGFNNEVIGYVGYDRDHQTKYLLSKSYGFGQSTTFYGMNMMRWIYKMGFVVVVEGIVDCLWLWMQGIPAIALQGNKLTPFHIQVLKRFGYNVLLVPDNDETGHKAITFWTKSLPQASVLKLLNGKDIDEWRKVTDNPNLIHMLLSEWKQTLDMKMKSEYMLSSTGFRRVA